MALLENKQVVLAYIELISDNSRRLSDKPFIFQVHYGDPFGPLAMILCELGQIRKEATAADDSCAEVRLLGLPPNLKVIIFYLPVPLNLLTLAEWEETYWNWYKYTNNIQPNHFKHFQF